MVNYYYCFLPRIASIMEPLYQSLGSKPKKLKWGSKQQKVFEDKKTILASATTLSFPYPSTPLKLTKDVSSIAVRAFIEQTIMGAT